MTRQLWTVVFIIGIVAAVASMAGADTVAPLGLTNAAVGGGDLNTYTRGVQGGVGVNNIGLLVRVWGKVNFVDTTNQLFYIDDGSGLNDYVTPGTGIRVSYAGLAAGNTFTPPTSGQFIAVTGISSLFTDGYGLLPVVRARKQADLVVLQ